MAKRPNLTTELRGEQVLAFLACRGPIRHRWDVIPSSPEMRPEFGTLVLLRCDSCGTMRHDIFSRITGDLLARWYDYPEGYQDAERHNAAWWRAAWAEQLFPERPVLFLDGEKPQAKKGKKRLEPVPKPVIKPPTKDATIRRHYTKGVSGPGRKGTR